MISFEFLSATCVYLDTLNLFHVHLMAICKEKYLDTVDYLNPQLSEQYDWLFY